MKKIILVSATMALAMAAGSAAAENGPAAGRFGINVPLASNVNDFLINGKYFIARDMAVIAGVGLQMTDDGLNVAGSKSTNIGFQGGFRKYLKTDDLATFVGGKLRYTSTNSSNVTTFSVLGEVGAEYYLGKQFSLEGSVAAGYDSTSTTVGANTIKSTALGTGTVNVSANFYF